MSGLLICNFMHPPTHTELVVMSPPQCLVSKWPLPCSYTSLLKEQPRNRPYQFFCENATSERLRWPLGGKRGSNKQSQSTTQKELVQCKEKTKWRNTYVVLRSYSTQQRACPGGCVQQQHYKSEQVRVKERQIFVAYVVNIKIKR